MNGVGNVSEIVPCITHDHTCRWCGGLNVMAACVLRTRLRDGMQVADPFGPLVACPVLGGLAEVLALVPAGHAPTDGAA